MGLQARLMSQAMRKLTGSVSKANTCLIFINQVREKIGVMFGNPETTTGGRALKFYSSVRLEVRRIAAIKDGDVVMGNRTKIKVVKNKVPRRSAKSKSTFSTAKASRAKAIFWIWEQRTKWWKNPGPGSVMPVSAWDRAARTHGFF